MGKHFGLALQLPLYQREAKKQKTKALPKAANTANTGVYLLIGCAVLTMVYLVQVNSFATKGYEITKLQKKIDTLRDVNKTIAIDSASLQSMQQIQSDPVITSMVPITAINYVRPSTLSQR